MANAEHLAILREGFSAWHTWRKEHPDVTPDLSQVDLSGMRLSLFDLSKVNLSGVRLNKANLFKTNLFWANLGEASLDEASFRDADLRSAHLYRASLTSADLSESNLITANFSQADLRRANFTKAKLDWADLGGAHMSDTIFATVDLSTVIGLSAVQHQGPSIISIDTLYLSHGEIPANFLRGCGAPDILIEYLPSLIGAMQPIQFHSCFISYSWQDEDFVSKLHERMRAEHLRVWFAPEDIKGGEKLHEQIEGAIQMHDRLLLILSEQSIHSAWVQQELRRARHAEIQSQRRKLFPIRLVDFKALQEWECMDSRTGSDLAEEVRQYFIPDFSDWKNHDAFERAFARLLRDLKATNERPMPMFQPTQHRARASKPITLSREEIAQQQTLLAIHRRTLAHELQRLALLTTAHAPPEIIHGIAEARANIARIKVILRASGVEVADHPDDEA
jgi:uncharacterized protein YjbI with pentapeptide repeats